MMLLESILVYSGLFCLAFGVLVMGSLYYNARLWLQDYPKEMQAVVPPLTTTEKRDQKLLMLPILLLMFGMPILAISQMKLANGGVLTFGEAYFAAFIMTQSMNLFDAVILDYLILTRFTPKFAILPGTEHLLYLFHDPRLHLMNFAKGFVICTALALPMAVIGMVL